MRVYYAYKWVTKQPTEPGESEVETVLDILLVNGIVITMATERLGEGILENGAVGIQGNKIAVVGNSKDICARYQAHRTIDVRGNVIMPGFVDGHMHSGLGLFRGMAQDTSQWLHTCIWPLREAMRPEESAKGSMLVLAEALRNGTTTICDFDTNMDYLVENHAKIGSRACIAHNISALPPDVSGLPEGELYPLDYARENQFFAESLKLIQHWQGACEGRITCMLGPQAPERVSKEMLVEIREAAQKYDLRVHMHVACGDRETYQMEKRYHQRTIPFLQELGMLNRRLLGIHLSVATDRELQLYAESGAGMVLCSGSEAIIDGHIPPAYEFDRFSPMLALGSDQTPGGNSCNMFNEMKFTAILNKCRFQDPTVFPCWKVLRMATIDGARAIGLGDQIGSLEHGKLADVIVIDTTRLNLNPILFSPVRTIIPNLVYSANGSEVRIVIVNGKIVVEEGHLTLVDESNIRKEANEAAKNVVARAAKKIQALHSHVTQVMRQNLI